MFGNSLQSSKHVWSSGIALDVHLNPKLSCNLYRREIWGFPGRQVGELGGAKLFDADGNCCLEKLCSMNFRHKRGWRASQIDLNSWWILVLCRDGWKMNAKATRRTLVSCVMHEHKTNNNSVNWKFISVLVWCFLHCSHHIAYNKWVMFNTPTVSVPGFEILRASPSCRHLQPPVMIVSATAMTPGCKVSAAIHPCCTPWKRLQTRRLDEKLAFHRSHCMGKGMLVETQRIQIQLVLDEAISCIATFNIWPGDGEWSCGARAEHQSGKLSRCVRYESVRCTQFGSERQRFVSTSFWYHWYHECPVGMNVQKESQEFPEMFNTGFPYTPGIKRRISRKRDRGNKRSFVLTDQFRSHLRLPSEQQLCLWRVEPWRWRVSIFGVPLDVSRNVFVEKFSKFLRCSSCMFTHRYIQSAICVWFVSWGWICPWASSTTISTIPFRYSRLCQPQAANRVSEWLLWRRCAAIELKTEQMISCSILNFWEIEKDLILVGQLTCRTWWYLPQLHTGFESSFCAQRLHICINGQHSRSYKSCRGEAWSQKRIEYYNSVMPSNAAVDVFVRAIHATQERIPKNRKVDKSQAVCLDLECQRQICTRKCELRLRNCWVTHQPCKSPGQSTEIEW